MTLTTTETLAADDHKTINDGLFAFNRAVQRDDWQRLFVVLRDDAGEIAGGLIAETYWDWMFVETLWVREDKRGQGWGTQLLRTAEDEARRRGCHSAYLDTFSFQALPFYQKQGYAIFGELPNYPGTQTRYFLQRALRSETNTLSSS